MQPKKYTVDFGGKELKLEVGQLADQANGACLVTYGGTTVLATAVMSKWQRDCDYMPLTLEYEEKLYAAGKIKQSRFLKREGRASDEAVLTGRMIDRTLRPRFDQRIRNEIQVVCTVLSFDKENDADMPAMIAASTALMISDIPWGGPIAGIRVGRINGKIVLNPTYEQRMQSDYDIVVAGRENRVNMLEAAAKETPEKDILEAIEHGQKEAKKIAEWQKKIAAEIGIEKKDLELSEPDPKLLKLATDFLADKLEKLIYIPEKVTRLDKLFDLQEELIAELSKSDLVSEMEEKAIKSFAEEVFGRRIDEIVHHNILTSDKRPDGRKLDEVREINCQVSFLPRTHGSGVFERGSTQALSVVTLGGPKDELTLEGMEVSGTKHFFHHYNFPPFSVGETGRIGMPGRRDIGHGALAEKALVSLIPDRDKFPYTIRVVSEILSSNGSSSMASVSGSSLALMDAGVPIKTAASGIAMGLMSDEKGNFKILTDIQGPEDHHGDMDCKIAGTNNGVTSFQMDVKIEGVTLDILEKTFAQAKKARLHILEKMSAAIKEPNKELSPYAPRITTIQIDPEKIGMVIGPQGKMINDIIDQSGANIDIEDDGQVFITADSQESSQKAEAMIKNIVREPKAGEIFQGKVVKITDFGAFVEILPGHDGLIHISELAPYRVNRVEDVVSLNDVLPVKVKEIDAQGRIKLTIKDLKK